MFYKVAHLLQTSAKIGKIFEFSGRFRILIYLNLHEKALSRTQPESAKFRLVAVKFTASVFFIEIALKTIAFLMIFGVLDYTEYS